MQGSLLSTLLVLLLRLSDGVVPDDIMGTKVWLDTHVFNSTLKTTKLDNGQKVFKMNRELARQRGIEDFSPDARPTLCFLGLGDLSFEYLVKLAHLFPELAIVLLEVSEPAWLEVADEAMGGTLKSRVVLGRLEDFEEARGAARRTCKAISWSADTPPFSFYRYRELFYSSPYILALFNMEGCTVDTRRDSADNYYCEYLYSSFQSTLCGRLDENKQAEYNGLKLAFPMVDTGCGENICMCHAHSDAFLDFHFEHMCRKNQEHRFMGQWGQDKFLMENVFAKDNRRNSGFYVDVGASHPYHLSNTAYFDNCLGWQGVCMEPNPRSKPILSALRTCRVVSACAWANSTTFRFENKAELAGMTDDESLKSSVPYNMEDSNPGATYFEARCAPLHDLLIEGMPTSQLMGASRPVIDLMSVDAEGAEIEIFRNFPFEAWDIRAIVIETSRRSSMAIDGLLLTNGFLKIAVLGKDAVYLSRAQAEKLPAQLRLPKRIAWNEPGSDADTIDYKRFQRMFGTDGDLDVDVGDQRLLNETEVQRQADRLARQQEADAKRIEVAAEGSAMGGVMSEKQLSLMEQEWVQDYLRNAKVKAAIAELLGGDDEDKALDSFLRLLDASPTTKGKVIDLLKVGVLVHKKAAEALSVQPDS
eukprot:TRINITY_DN111081_c0_g1_i1.p1 TRINITY_DN111081_c0_g1~~TRINITY_DN111081_c0_g1_i1.p1  ORF type:complete len:645 (+),score=104.72 TRINITY_DN111081_c0_g1_i1:184-2118(+)